MKTAAKKKAPTPLPALPTVSVVAEGAGPSLPDRAAHTAAKQWIAVFAGEENRTSARMKQSNIIRIGGTPKSQLKNFERVKKVFGDSLVRAVIAPGKRAHFGYQLDLLFSGKAIDRVNETGAPETWLYVERLTTVRRGPDRPTQYGETVVGAFSLHALARSIQRAGVCSAKELRKFIANNWEAVSQLEYFTRKLRAETQGQIWYLPAIGNDGELYAFIIENVSDDGFPIIVVKTVLTRDMIPPGIEAALLELHDFMLRNNQREDYLSLAATALRLIEACRA